MRSRREVLGMLGAVGASPAIAWARPGEVQARLPWAAFRETGDYPRLVEAVRRLKAARDAASPDSWTFWAAVHQQHCPHGTGYFLAWHRGYLHLFEEKLRQVSGSATLRVPYWDYFADPRIPEELTQGNAASNPLFEPRKGGSVAGALAYAAFGDDVTGFERGRDNCFEAKVEAFHNNIHNLVGGRMATMLSPHDMLFWLHHANIDRLWTAWAAAGKGRAMPAGGAPYWAGRLDYADELALARSTVASCEALGYRYTDLTLPVPPVAREAAGEPSPPPPPPPPPAAAAPAPIPFRGMWLGGARRTYLRLHSRGPAPIATADTLAEDIVVLLDAVSLTAAGAEGGYFYKLYLDLDDGSDPSAHEERLLGSVGPFQIAAALHHEENGRVRLALPVGEVIRAAAPGRALDELGVVFVRVDAGGPPAGNVIGIGEVAIAAG